MISMNDEITDMLYGYDAWMDDYADIVEQTEEFLFESLYDIFESVRNLQSPRNLESILVDPSENSGIM